MDIWRAADAVGLGEIRVSALFSPPANVTRPLVDRDPMEKLLHRYRNFQQAGTVNGSA